MSSVFPRLNAAAVRAPASPFYNNPWIIGTVTGVLSGIILALITPIFLRKRRVREISIRRERGSCTHVITPESPDFRLVPLIENVQVRDCLYNGATMTGLTSALHTALDAAGIGGLLYTVTITVTTAAAVFAREPCRRRDARAALALLLGRRHQSFGRRNSRDIGG
jgi:hypothetical protein